LIPLADRRVEHSPPGIKLRKVRCRLAAAPVGPDRDLPVLAVERRGAAGLEDDDLRDRPGPGERLAHPGLDLVRGKAVDTGAVLIHQISYIGGEGE